jgi:drug/metabolite transporter (DMT)-like permease
LIKSGRLPADTGAMRRPFGLIVPVIVMCGGLPVAAFALVGEHHVLPPLWVHFYGVGLSALAATALAVAVTWQGVRRTTCVPSSSAAASRSWRRSSPCTV